MNKILIVDASDSDRRLMSGLLTRAGYEPVIAEEMEAAKQEVTKLSPGAVIVSAMKRASGSIRIFCFAGARGLQPVWRRNIIFTRHNERKSHLICRLGKSTPAETSSGRLPTL